MEGNVLISNTANEPEARGSLPPGLPPGELKLSHLFLPRESMGCLPSGAGCLAQMQPGSGSMAATHLSGGGVCAMEGFLSAL